MNQAGNPFWQLVTSPRLLILGLLKILINFCEFLHTRGKVLVYSVYLILQSLLMESQELSKNSPIFQNITIHSAKIIGIGTNYHPLITDITKWDLWMGKIKNKNWNVWRYVKLLIPSLSAVTEFACSWLLFNQYHLLLYLKVCITAPIVIRTKERQKETR